MNSTERLIFVIMMLFSITLVKGIPVESSTNDSSNQNISDLCVERNVAGALVDPSDTDCTRYIHCYNINGEWQAKRLKCPEGQFFDVALSICSSLKHCSH